MVLRFGPPELRYQLQWQERHHHTGIGVGVGVKVGVGVVVIVYAIRDWFSTLIIIEEELLNERIILKPVVMNLTQ